LSEYKQSDPQPEAEILDALNAVQPQFKADAAQEGEWRAIPFGEQPGLAAVTWGDGHQIGIATLAQAEWLADDHNALTAELRAAQQRIAELEGRA
jgi:hypothetical protein